MKLNLGCGGVYKKDYLNVDAFDSAVADRIMSAIDINLKDNSVEEIEASQLIEHLGFVSSLYALSECFRVLKPNGKLIIETPDINSSFEKYLLGDYKCRKNIISWIYGVDTPGMLHRFCFPDELLEETCKKIGFIEIKKEFIELDKYQPILRIICTKPTKYHSAQFITVYRKKLLQNKLINLKNQILSLEQESLIDFFSSKMSQLYENKDSSTLNEITIFGAVCSPKMTHIFLKTLIDKNVSNKKKIKCYLASIELLVSIDFPNILCSCLRVIPDMVGEQKLLFQTIVDMGKATAKNILNENNKSSSFEILSKTRNKVKQCDSIDFFSEKMLRCKANSFFQHGTKAFTLQRYDEAIDMFKFSISYYRNQILSYWNLGRLFALTNDLQQSKKYYDYALNILIRIDCKSNVDIKNKIENELNGRKVKKPKNPIISLNSIIES